MNFIGDVHGKFDQYYNVLESLNGDTIQVGDMGIGFGRNLSPNHSYFIHGNHDNPDLCHVYNGFLGRYGYVNIDGYKIFYVSGADSIDKCLRTIGVDWWENEQLTYREMSNAINIYNGADIIVSHDCPASLYPKFNIRDKNLSITAKGLDVIFQHSNKPKLWIFGHHHKSHQIWDNGIDFRCLDELEALTI